MKRGAIYYADLDPARTSETNKRRPVVIVSNNSMNRTVSNLGEGVITVVPLTSNVRRVYDFQVFLPALATGLPQDSKAQAEQVRSISVERLGQEAVGQLPTDLLDKLGAALRLHLDL